MAEIDKPENRKFIWRDTWTAKFGTTILNAIAAPGRAWNGYYVHQPEVPGQWSETDEVLAQEAYRQMLKDANGLAGLVMGGGMPMAGRAAVGMAGGRLRQLPMDEASRLARAKELGFRTEMPLYHGSGQTFSQFKAAPTSAAVRDAPGVSLARDPEIANEFAQMAGQGRVRGREWSDNVQTNPQVYKLWHRADRPVSIRLEGNEAHHEVVATLQDAFVRGYDSVMLRNYTSPGGRKGDIIIVRDANQLRSPNAAFDPANRNSTFLLGSGQTRQSGLGAVPTFADDQKAGYDSKLRGAYKPKDGASFADIFGFSK